MPALFTRMSIPPDSSACATAAATSSSEVTSPASPSPFTSPATRRAASPEQSRTTTREPAAASRRQMASPMPWPPPVTSAVLPSSRKKVVAVVIAWHQESSAFSQNARAPRRQRRMEKKRPGPPAEGPGRQVVPNRHPLISTSRGTTATAAGRSIHNPSLEGLRFHDGGPRGDGRFPHGLRRIGADARHRLAGVLLQRAGQVGGAEGALVPVRLIHTTAVTEDQAEA